MTGNGQAGGDGMIRNRLLTPPAAPVSIPIHGCRRLRCHRKEERQMSRFLERAKELRAVTERHYNCAQSVLVPFAETLGLDEEKAYALAGHFGSGMRMGATCGAVTGGLMVLGLAGADDPESAARLTRTVREHHEGCLDCKDLLRMNAEAGRAKKPHCDAMVYECVEIVETILREKGVI